MNPYRVLVVSGADIEVLTPQLTPDSLMTMSARLFRALSSTDDAIAGPPTIQVPPRNVIHAQNHNILFMPSRFVGHRPMTAVKAVASPYATAPPSVKELGLPGATMVFDENTGAVKALVNASKLTAIRTSAGSALATKLFANPGSKKLVIFGTGAQSEWHARLIAPLLTQLAEVVFIARTPDSPKSLSFLAAMTEVLQRPGLEVTMRRGDQADVVVAEADVICTCTPSTTPLFSTSALSASKPVHINAIGSWTPFMMEFDLGPILESHPQGPSLGPLVVDSVASCKVEAGEIMSAVAAKQLSWSEVDELGKFVDGEGNADQEALFQLKRRKRGNVSLFKAVGVGAQDVAVAEVVVELAARLGVGASVPF